GFAGPGFADQAHGLALGNRQVDGLKRAHHASPRPIAQANIDNVQKRRRLHCDAVRGLSADPSASPNRLNASTVKKIAAPGNSDSHQALNRKRWPLLSMRPQLIISALLRPKKLKAASRRIACPTIKLPAARAGARALGMTSPAKI